MACIAGSVVPLFVAFGACPRFLFSGAVMGGPGSLVAAKIMFPETQKSHCTRVKDLELPPACVHFHYTVFLLPNGHVRLFFNHVFLENIVDQKCY
jgi:hypothetical protein